MRRRTGLSPWRFVVAFGTVSLLMDVVYEGARSITGPLLAGLGASAAVVGVVTGAGEAAALGLRLVSGPLADRTRRFWGLTIGGYALTAASVPLIGLTGVLWVACALVVAERVGKAVRSPAKDTLLSHATAVTGRGRGFAVHEAMDQVGALIGPLIVAGVLAASGGYGLALGVLALPGIAALAVLWWLRARVPDPAAYETGTEPRHSLEQTRLPRAFWVYAAFTAMTMAGFATFGVLAFHLVERHLVPAALVPVIYAAAMAAGALAALATGWLYGRVGPRALGQPAGAGRRRAAAGVQRHGVAGGAQRAALGRRGRCPGIDAARGGGRPRPGPRRATAYGIFAGVLGAATFGGGALTGALYGHSTPALIVTVAAIQAAALVLLAVTRIRRPLPPIVTSSRQ